MIKASNFDYLNDIDHNAYLLYKNKLITARTYEHLFKNSIKIFIPEYLNIDQVVEINRKNKILQNKKDFESYKLTFKEHIFEPNLDFLLATNKAIETCKDAYKLNATFVLSCISLFAFQVFSTQDCLEILEQNNFKNPINIFNSLKNKNLIIRIDNGSSSRKNQVYTFTDNGIELVKLFYEIIEKSSFLDFKFKSKRELLIDNILNKAD